MHTMTPEAAAKAQEKADAVLAYLNDHKKDPYGLDGFARPAGMDSKRYRALRRQKDNDFRARCKGRLVWVSSPSIGWVKMAMDLAKHTGNFPPFPKHIQGTYRKPIPQPIA